MIDEKKIQGMVLELPDLIQDFGDWWYDEGGGPSLYFYQKTISRVRESDLESLLEDKDFIELLYATLTAWDMDSRAASLKDFGDFRRALTSNREEILDISDYRLDELDEKEFEDVEAKLKDLYQELDVMKSNRKFVSNSKTLHFTVPDLVMPMDTRYTLPYFWYCPNLR